MVAPFLNVSLMVDKADHKDRWDNNRDDNNKDFLVNKDARVKKMRKNNLQFVNN